MNEDDGARVGCGNRRDELVLPDWQRHVFAVRGLALEVPDDDNRDFRFACQLGGRIRARVCIDREIDVCAFEPARDRLCGRDGANGVHLGAAASAGGGLCRPGSKQGNAHRLRRVERQEVPLVPEEHRACGANFTRDSCVLLLWNGKGHWLAIEEAEPEHLAEPAEEHVVDSRFRHRAVGHGLE